jgi:hypothetical protein
MCKWLIIIGLGFQLLGAFFLAYGLILCKKQAIKLGLSRWSADSEEEILKLPQIQDRLKQSRNAGIGIILLSIGFVLQIVGSWPY